MLTNREICADSAFIVGPTPEQNVKLPVIDLPKFDGNYGSWLEFRDIFESLINNNSAINGIQKFHYLLSSLSGDARQVIASLEITNSNYDVAWGLVRTRYDNSRVLIQNHAKALFDIEKTIPESFKSIRNFIDNIRKHMRALTSLNQPTDNWDTLIIYLATTKMDSGSNREWEQRKVAVAQPNLDNFQTY
nr:uncharacterized protein LOC111420865 [Onthophagus taurus]